MKSITHRSATTRGARFLGTLFISVLLFVSCRDTVSSKSGLPNVVLIVIDTLRPDHLPFYGYDENTAPFLNQIASKSAVFDNAFSTSSWTSPAMASIMTSTYPFQNGVVLNLHAINVLEKNNVSIPINRIPDGIQTIAEILKSSGYATFGVADNINVSDPLGFARGFDKFQTENYKGAETIDSIVMGWKDEIESHKPYFLYIHYMDPHVPYHKRNPWYEERLENRSDLGEDVIEKEFVVVPGKPNPFFELAYDSEINYVDQEIRDVFDEFQFGKNAIAVIVGDHGQEFWDHGRHGHNHALYNEVIRVPYLIYAPGGGIKSRRILDRVSTLDIAPTLMDFLGLPIEESFEGQSLLPLLLDGQSAPQERCFFSHLVRKRGENSEGVDKTMNALIRGEWKYIVSQPGSEMLFNLRDDPLESVNLVDEFPDMGDSLVAHVWAFQDSCRKYVQQSAEYTLDEEKVEHLRALGYVD